MLSFFCRFTYYVSPRYGLMEEAYLPGSSSKKLFPTTDSLVIPDQAV